MTFGPDGDETADKGVWLSIWVNDVDHVHRHCLEQGLDVAWPPTDMPWNVREMHVRHPDGHVFRISKGVGEDEQVREASRREARCHSRASRKGGRSRSVSSAGRCGTRPSR